MQGYGKHCSGGYEDYQGRGTEEITYTGHNSGAWNVDFEPTAGRDGQMTRYCTYCGLPLESKAIIGNSTDNNGGDSDVSDGNNGNTDNNDNNADNSACNHICHKKGFSAFFWKMMRFFWKMFRINPVCECGAAHY